MELTVRRAAPSEAEALSAFMRRLFLAAYSHSADAPNVARHVGATFVPAQQALELADPALETLLAESAEGWVGCAQLRPASRPPVVLDAGAPAELRRFYIDAPWHGSGAAARLMQSVADRAAQAVADALWLYVWQQAPRAIRFYEKCGFRIAGTAVFMVGDRRNDDWVMWRPLAAGAPRQSSRSSGL